MSFRRARLHERCTAEVPHREDERCHNYAFILGLCKTHLRTKWKIRACQHCLGAGYELMPVTVTVPRRRHP